MGDGKFTHIWNDRWLSNKNRFKVFSPPKILNKEATMDNPFLVERFVWNNELIYQILQEFEVEQIKQLSISCEESLDRQI